MLQGKKIILGITGGIAAYKIAFLIRLLKKNGAAVKCVLTPASSDFISPLTVATLSENPAYSVFWNKEDGKWTNHVDLGMWADLMVIAPLTANTLAKMAHGICDNLLLATYRSVRCPVITAPAMDLDMYAHPSTREGLTMIAKQGVQVIPAEKGFLASGLEGEGRMAEPETIFDTIQTFFEQQNSLKGKKVLITAGPTYEAIDPVRFIGNHSSGKMGFALAENVLQRGGEVVLISGPTACELYHEKLELISIASAEEMLAATQSNWEKMDIGIFAAAVSDYRPAEKAIQKIKKDEETMNIKLVKNPDILKWAGENKADSQWLCGFALETKDGIKHAKQKLLKKNLDMIVLNSLEDKGAGFGHNTNKIHILDKDNNSKEFELSTKTKTADHILAYLIAYCK